MTEEADTPAQAPKKKRLLPAGTSRPRLVCYEPKRFNDEHEAIIRAANRIIDRYRVMGYTLTLRQLFYQFVQRNLIRNTQKEYNRLGEILNAGRMAGRIDWKAIEDRTRNVREYNTFKNPGEAMLAAAHAFQRQKWAKQHYRPEVWIEKDALLGVISPMCHELQVPYFSCRGYTSQSEQWRAAQRFIKRLKAGHQPIVFHLGDHDPSGLDMTRDNAARLNRFISRHVPGGQVIMQRLALNRDQIDHYRPPPNPAKMSDSRSSGYVAEHGHSSWELDALSPPVIGELIKTAVLTIRDEAIWEKSVKEEAAQREAMIKAARELNPKKPPDEPPPPIDLPETPS